MNLRSAVALGLRLGLVFLFVLLLNEQFGNTAAQSFRGGIRGEITDAHGLPVAGAKVIARDLGTSESREGTAEAEGDNPFLGPHAGEDEVAAGAPGFQESPASPVWAVVGAETTIRVSLGARKR